MALLGMRRDGEGAEAMARRIVALVPGHRNAQMRIVDRLVARDPDAAFAHLQSLMAQTQHLVARYELRDWLAHTRLRAGHTEAAVDGWVDLHDEAAPPRQPPPEPHATTAGRE